LAREAATYTVLSKGNVAPLKLVPPNLSPNLPDAPEYDLDKHHQHNHQFEIP
jgi:hypothetical protein